MSDELEVCLTALFLNKGKDVLTVKEFIMYVSLDLRWMPVKDANNLVDILLSEGMISKTGDYLRPLIDILSVEVPVAYRPSEVLLNSIKNEAKGKGPSADAAPERAAANPLPRLIQAAIDSGMDKGAFISECNKVQKRTNIDTEVAALMILRERGVDIMPFLADVRSSVLK